MRRPSRLWPLFVISILGSCADGEFVGSQRAVKKDDCKEDGPGCKKLLELGEPTESLAETTGEETKGGTTPGTLTPDSGSVKVGVVVTGSTTTPATSTTDGLCTIPRTNVGVSAKRMGPNWRCKQESMTIADAIVLPDDATDIDIKIVQYGVDDWNPCTKINGQVIGCNRKEKTQCTSGGPGPRVSQYNFDLSPHLKAGSNELYVESFNKHTYWSMWFTVQGTYKSLQQGCKHSLKLIKN